MNQHLGEMRTSSRATRAATNNLDLLTFDVACSKLDALAESILAHLAPIRYAAARTNEEREDIFRLRFRAVIDRGWARPEDFPDGLERDSDDESAVLVGGWNGTTPVAAARMIFPIHGLRLPVETLFGVDVEPPGQVVQVDRDPVDRTYRERTSRLLLGMIAHCWLELRRRGYHVWTGVESPGMLRLYRRLGFDMTVLGSARRYWNEDRFPVRFDPVDFASGIIDRLGTWMTPAG